MALNLKSKNRAFALLSVLAIAILMMFLIGGLMANNRSSFNLLKQSYTQDSLDRTENSVFAYCQLRLEDNFNWGKEAFVGDSRELGQLTVVEVNDNPGNPADLQILRGTDLVNHNDFEVEICNNLNGSVTLATDLGSGLKDGVPQGFCRLRILAKADRREHTVEILVRNPGLIGASLLANGDLDVDSETFQMMSKDPVKNQARSMNDVRITGMTDFVFSEASGSTPPGTSQEDPIIWAGEQAQFRNNSTSSFQDRESFKASNGSRSFQDEKFKEQSKTSFEIPEIELDDLAEVKGPGDKTKVTQTLASGVYEFQQTTVGGEIVRILALRESGSQATGLRDSQGPIKRFWYSVDGIYSSSSGPSTSAVARAIGAPTTAPGSNHNGRRYANLDTTGASVDLLQRRIVFDDQYNFKVNGDFAIRSKPVRTSATGPGEYLIKPSLFFANPDLLPEQNFQYTDGAQAAETDDGNRGDLRSTGRIHIEGDISGSATIAGTGDVSIAPTRFYDSNGDSSVDFSIYSGGDVSIIPPRLLEAVDNRTGTSADIAQTVTTSDGTILHVEHNSISQNELVFTGLIYAKGEVRFDLRDTEAETQKRSFKVEGSVVAKGGDLTIENSENFEIVYNPQFVDQLLPTFFQTNQNRIEVTGWRTK